MNPVPPASPSTPSPDTSAPAPLGAPGAFERLLGDAAASGPRPARAGVHPALPAGAIPLLPPLPGLPLFAAARPGTVPSPPRAEVGPLPGPWGTDLGLRIRVVEVSGEVDDTPGVEPDPDVRRWIDELLRDGAEADTRTELPEPAPRAPHRAGSAHAAIPGDTEASSAPPPVDRPAPSGSGDGRPSGRPDTEDRPGAEDPARFGLVEMAGPTSPGASAAGPAGSTAPAAPGARAAPELAAHLPAHLKLAVEDGRGAWEMDLHRHAGVMDLVLRGDDDLRLLVRDAHRELRQAVATASARPGEVRWEPAAAGNAASTDPGTQDQGGDPGFERWRSLIEAQPTREGSVANGATPDLGSTSTHILDRRV